VAIVFVGNAFQTYIKSRGARSGEDSSELEETLAKIEVLEERIRVLERIVTENKYDLKSEINSL
jgi:hypothetical protein